MAELTIEEMRVKVNEADHKRMLEAEVESAKAMQPLNDFLASKELAKVKKDAQELAVTYVSDDTINQKITALRMALRLFD